MLLFVFFDQPLQSNFPSIIAEIKIILFAFIGFAFLGILDDLSKIFLWQKTEFHGLRLRYKLLLEIILASIVAYWLFFDLKISFFNIPFFGVYKIGWWYIPIATFIMVSFANAVNITDGLDGLATGISSISFLSLGIISYTDNNNQALSFVCIALAGATLGFLRYNFNPAKIFLGDTGSLFLGFMLGGISLLGAMKTATISSVTIPIILIGLPAIDTSFSIIRRLLKKVNIRMTRS